MTDPYSAVFKNLEKLPEGVNTEIRGYDFNKGIDYNLLLQSYYATGFQATNFALAVKIINDMIECKEVPLIDNNDIKFDSSMRQKSNCTIFLGYTSNMISSGVREYIRYIAQHNFIDVIVTSAGGIEEDFIKCMKPSYVGSFDKYNDSDLRKTGINRIGNMLIANENYVEFEQWILPIISQMHKEQDLYGINWTPSKFFHRLGKEINNEDSVYYWCYKNDIFVSCPAIYDGSIGDILNFYGITNPGFYLHEVDDKSLVISTAERAVNTGMIILGDGAFKDRITSANKLRNGSDFSVYINTGNECSDSCSGEIKETSEHVTLISEASLVFPLIVAQTFGKSVESKKHI